MALDIWIALVFALIFLIYGYTAFFGMDHLLAPIMKKNPVWPSSFPKILSVAGLIISMVVFLNLEKPSQSIGDDMLLSKWRQYRLFDAVIFIFGMIFYAMFLRDFGFLAATFLFLFLGGVLLGERRYLLSLIISGASSYGIWYLVDSVLGIYMTPYPQFVKTLGSFS